jgi:hypothetical protein
MSDQVETGTLIPYLTEMFRFQAWMAMGKVANPMSGDVERDLRAARHMIDLLGELESRTAGNRSSDETKMLQGALTELRLNYLEEMKKPEPETKDAAKDTPATDEGNDAPRDEAKDTPQETPEDAPKGGSGETE